MFKKHVAHPTLDACTRALVHATSDGSDATKVRVWCRPAAMCIQLKLLTGPEGGACSWLHSCQCMAAPYGKTQGPCAYSASPTCRCTKGVSLANVQLLHDCITSVLL